MYNYTTIYLFKGLNTTYFSKQLIKNVMQAKFSTKIGCSLVGSCAILHFKRQIQEIIV